MRLATVVLFTALATLVACSDDAQKQGESPANNQGSDADTNSGTEAGMTVQGTVPTNELEVCTEGWCWFHPRPYGSTLQAVHGAGDDLFIVGSGGLVLQRSSGRWSAESVGDTDLFDVFAVNDQLAYAAGPALDLRAGGYVYGWDGATWERVHTIEGEEVPGVGLPAPGFTPASIWAAEDEAYVGFADRVAHFDGDQWSDVPTPRGGGWIADIACAETCWVVGQIGSHLAFADGGFIWRLENGEFVDEGIQLGPLTAIELRDDGSPVATGPAGVLFERTEEGWGESIDRTPGSIADLLLNPDGRDWMAWSDRTFWEVSYREETGGWQEERLPIRRVATYGPARRLPDMHANASEFWWVGPTDDFSGGIARLAESEWETFLPKYTIQTELLDIAASSNTLAAATENSIVVWNLADQSQTTIEGGATQVWVSEDDTIFALRDSVVTLDETGSEQPVEGAPESAEAFFPFDETNMIVASGNEVWMMESGEWTQTVVADDLTVTHLWARSPQDAYAAVASPRTKTLLWHFDGLEWTPLEGVDTSDIREVFALSGNEQNVLALGNGIGYRVVDYDGASITDSGAPGAVTDIMTDDGEFLVSGLAGTVWRGNPDGWDPEPQLAQMRLNALTPAPDGTIWAAGSLGIVLRYRP